MIVNKGQFLEKLSLAYEVIPRNPVAPIYSCVHLSSKDNRLQFFATDITSGILLECVVKEVNANDFSCSTPAKILLDVLRNASGETIEISYSPKEGLIIKEEGDKGIYVLPVLTEEFCIEVSPPSTGDAIALSEEFFHQLKISHHLFKNCPSFYDFVRGVQISLKDSDDFFINTITQIFFYSCYTGEMAINGEKEIVFPWERIGVLSRLKDTSSKMHFLEEKGKVWFFFTGKDGMEIKYFCQLLDIKPPQIRPLLLSHLQKELHCKIAIPREDLMNLLQRCLAGVTNSYNTLKICISENQIILEIRNPELETHIQVKKDCHVAFLKKDPYIIGVNFKFLKSIVEAGFSGNKQELFYMSFFPHRDAFLIQDSAENVTKIYMLMPIQLNELD